MDAERLASELIRALRGKRSQVAVSRRLGYRSNALSSWESGAGFPTAATFFHMARKLSVEPETAIARFYVREPAWLADTDVATAEGVARLLEDLRGRTPILNVAQAAGRSRFAVARWLKAEAQPRLPDFLRLVQAMTLRAVDLVAQFVDPAQLPEARAEWERLQVARQAAFERPWSHAVLRMLETAAYAALPTHQPGWIAARLGIEPEEEARCLDLLTRTGQVRFKGGRYDTDQSMTIDTRSRPEDARALAAWWAGVGAQKLAEGGAGNFAYNVFAVSDADLERIRELQRGYFAQLRAIVAESEPAERVVLVNLQLCELDRNGTS